MKYRAKPGLRIPMPDRPGQLVPEGEGTAVDEMNPFYARLIADGDLVPDAGKAAPAKIPSPALAPGAAAPEGDK